MHRSSQKKIEWGRIVDKLENVSASKPETTSILVAVVIIDTNVYFSTCLNCEIFLPVLAQYRLYQKTQSSSMPVLIFTPIVIPFCIRLKGLLYFKY